MRRNAAAATLSRESRLLSALQHAPAWSAEREMRLRWVRRPPAIFGRTAGRFHRNGIKCGKGDKAGDKAADMRLPGNRLFDAGHADRSRVRTISLPQTKQPGTQSHPRITQARRQAALRARNKPRRDCATARGGPPRWNAKRMAAAMAPEIAADAPIIGSSSPKCVAKCTAAPAAAVVAIKARNRQRDQIAAPPAIRMPTAIRR